MADLIQYWNEKVANLRQGPNTDNHSAHLATIKQREWSYPAQGNLQTVRQFIKDLKACGDLEKIKHGEHMLRDHGLPGIPQDNTPMGTKRERIKACYVMHILRSIEGEVIDTTHPDFSRVQNIGLHDIVSPESMNCVEKNGQVIYGGQVFQKKVDAGYCLLCMYSSQNHQMLNNHVWLHFRMVMFCGMLDCWYISHSAEDMWKHVVGHSLATAEPIAQTKHGKKK